MGTGSQVLYGPGDGISQLACRPQRPVRITQKLSRHDGEVALAGTNDMVSLRRSCDHSHRTRQDFRLAPNSFCEGRFVPRPHGNSGRRHISSGGTINQVDTGILQALGQRHGIVESPPAFPPSRSPKCARTKARFPATFRELRGPPRPASACGSPASRRIHRCGDWPGAKETPKSDNRAQRESRSPGILLRGRGGRAATNARTTDSIPSSVRARGFA